MIPDCTGGGCSAFTAAKRENIVREMDKGMTQAIDDAVESLTRELARHNGPHALLDPGNGVVLDALVGELCKVVGANPECRYAIKRLLAAMRDRPPQPRSDCLPQPRSDCLPDCRVCATSTLLRDLRSDQKRACVEVREKNGSNNSENHSSANHFGEL